MRVCIVMGRAVTVCIVRGRAVRVCIVISVATLDRELLGFT